MFMVEPEFFQKYSYSWFVVSILMFHSLLDTIGRYCAGIPQMMALIPKGCLLGACCSRIIFVVLYMLTILKVNENIFGSDWFILSLFTVFSISCGYLSTIGMVYGTDDSTKNKSLAGSIMGFSLIFGITLGSFIAMLCLSKYE
jgi:MFS family permease